MWQVQLPQESLKQEFLLHGFFSLAALEIALTTNTSQFSFYSNAALEYYDHASSIFRKELSSIDSDKQRFLFAYSLIAIVLNFALPQISKARGEQTHMVDNMIVHYELLRGTRLIVEESGPKLQQDPILQNVQRFEDLTSEPLDPETEAAVARLHALNDARLKLVAGSPRASKIKAFKHHAACRYAILRLEESFGRCPQPLNRGHVLAWLRLAGGDFVDTLKTGDPIALLALMHWGLLVERCSEGIWWAQSVGKNLVDEITNILSTIPDPAFNISILWARTAIGLRSSQELR